jgi:hypothetical protein
LFLEKSGAGAVQINSGSGSRRPKTYRYGSYGSGSGKLVFIFETKRIGILIRIIFHWIPEDESGPVIHYHGKGLGYIIGIPHIKKFIV